MHIKNRFTLASTWTFGLTAIALSLSGCAVGPDYVRPKAAEVSSFVRSDAHDAVSVASSELIKAEIRRDWWHDYQSEALNEIVELALKHNPNIDAALANLKAAKAIVRSQQGVFFPQVSAGYSAQKGNTGNNVTAPTVNWDPNSNSYSLQTAQLNVGFTPDIFGLNRRQVESLEAQSKNAQYQLDALKTTIATNLMTAIIQEAALAEQYDAQQRAVHLGEQQLATARKLFASGYYSRVDLANQETIYSITVQSSLALKKSLDQVRDLIAVLCGQYPSETLKQVKLDTMHIPDKLPQAVPSQLVDKRPDVLAAEELVKSANAQIGVSIANMLPQFSIVGSMGGAANAISDMFISGNPFWALSSNVAQTIFDGGTLYFRKEAAQANTAQALAQYKSVVLVAYQNVADTLYALDADKKALNAAIENEKANQAILAATKQQFEKGYVSEPAYQYVEQSYLNAKTARLQAQALYMGDTVALYQALGGGWSCESSDAELAKTD